MNRQQIQQIVLVCACLLCANVLHATAYSYSAAEATTLSNKTFAAGDVITLLNGDWNNKSLRLRGTGTETAPIIVKAQTAGSVRLTGSSALNIDGKYIEVNGLSFEGSSTVGKTHVVTFSKNSSYCRFTNSAIRNYNPADTSVWPSTDNKWVSLNGTHNRVDHCYFEGKGNIGTLLVVWLVSGQAAYHRIDSNHFCKRTSLLDASNKELNGQEIIRVGDSSTSMTFAHCEIENNFFEQCNGEIEIISNKSCGNTYRNNVFFANNGALTLRHGNDCTVEGNYFLGNNVSGAGGIRVIGENHRIINNYFQDLKGSGYRTGICLIKGNTNPALNEYFQVKNALVAFNTFYNCSNVFNVGYSGGNDLAPISSTIAHNVIYAANNSQTGVNIADAHSEISWKNNLMYQGKFSSFTPTSEQFERTTINLNFASANSTYGIYKPTVQSAIATGYKTNDYPEINADIEGRIRPGSRMIGAFELAGEPARLIPTPQSIGCDFINKEGNSISQYQDTTKGSLVTHMYISDNYLHTHSQAKELTLRIINLQGKILYTARMENNGEKHCIQLPDFLNGMYIFSFHHQQAEEAKKVIINNLL